MYYILFEFCNKAIFILDAEAKKLVEVFKNVINSHANRLEEFNLFKNKLFIYKSPVNIKVCFVILLYCIDIILLMLLMLSIFIYNISYLILT